MEAMVRGPQEGIIFKQMALINRDIGAIKKDQQNSTQKFNFRGIDKVYNALHSVFAMHEVISLPTVLESGTEQRPTGSGGLLVFRILKIRYDFVAVDGSAVSTVVQGEAMDTGDKASNKAMSVAHKYALLQVFQIPTDPESVEDPDRHSETLADPESIRYEEFITEDQQKQIEAFLQNNNLKIDKLLKKRGISSISELPKTKFEGTMGFLLNEVQRLGGKS